ncbi:MAG: HD domain-containing protein [Actinomycetota bacterium]|nr:HD domain-containing protein [Actinomycetota bacterium]
MSWRFSDDGTYEHTERVARTAFLLARAIDLSEGEAELIHQAAPLHDLGKLAVGDAVLLKPGKLSVAEFEHIRKHPRAGAAILTGSASEVLQLAEEIASSHHEWWDGSGYPAGLSGEAIPLSGRIVAVADVFDALTHTRPYKHAWPIKAALAEITRLSGGQFDPKLVDAFLELDPSRLVDLPDDWPATAPGVELDRVASPVRPAGQAHR